MTDDLQARYEEMVLELETIVAPLDDRLAEVYMTKACLTAKLEYIQGHEDWESRIGPIWDDCPIDVRIEILGRGLEILREEFARAQKKGLIFSLN